jgi:chloramphenicol-sensitive protein RarD
VAGLLTLRGGWAKLWPLLSERRQVLLLGLSAAVIAVNWGVFILAVAAGRVLEASLGYFINPLVSVLLGFVFLGERLRPVQQWAVAVAGAGVLLRIVGHGTFPWIALVLAVSFGFYGLIRKVAGADALSGLCIETLILFPAAAVYLGVMAWAGTGSFGAEGLRLDLLLMAAGPVTVLPLLLFVAGARKVRLATIGLLQYIAPTGHFLLAVFAYDEPLTEAAVASFACIWLALILYSVDSISAQRHR